MQPNWIIINLLSVLLVILFALRRKQKKKPCWFRDWLRYMVLVRKGWRQVPLLGSGKCFYVKQYSEQYCHSSPTLDLAELQQENFCVWEPKPVPKAAQTSVALEAKNLAQMSQQINKLKK